MRFIGLSAGERMDRLIQHEKSAPSFSVQFNHPIAKSDFRDGVGSRDGFSLSPLRKRCGISNGCCPRIPRFHFVALYFDRRPTLKRKCGPSVVVLFLLSEDLAHALPKMGLLLQESHSLRTCRNLHPLGRWDAIGRLEIGKRDSSTGLG